MKLSKLSHVFDFRYQIAVTHSYASARPDTSGYHPPKRGMHVACPWPFLQALDLKLLHHAVPGNGAGRAHPKPLWSTPLGHQATQINEGC